MYIYYFYIMSSICVILSGGKFEIPKPFDCTFLFAKTGEDF